MRTMMLAALLSSAISTTASAQVALGEYTKDVAPAAPSSVSAPASTSVHATAELSGREPPMLNGFETRLGPGQRWHCPPEPRLVDAAFDPSLYGLECGNYKQTSKGWEKPADPQYPFVRVWYNLDGSGLLYVRPHYAQAVQPTQSPVARKHDFEETVQYSRTPNSDTVTHTTDVTWGAVAKGAVAQTVPMVGAAVALAIVERATGYRSYDYGSGYYRNYSLGLSSDPLPCGGCARR